jgi:endo-1,4-beta-D-glucanase Y
LPANLTSADARDVYEKWKRKYLKADCGGGAYRVEFNSPKGSTVSEGMGYGMLLTAYFGDRAEFDGLWEFARRNLNSLGVMGWKVTCGGFVQSEGGGSSATDGDNDIALALVVAVDQWGEAYRQPALDFLKAVKAHDYATCSATGRTLATAGDWDKGCNDGGSNTSYWMPAYFRVFQEFSGDAFWGKAADDAVALWLASRNPTTGLIANHVTQNGVAGQGQDRVDYNGCRIPWRAALDYLWFATPGAKGVMDTMSDWVDSNGIGTRVDGYNPNGTPTPGSKWKGSQCWNGGWATAAMSKSQDRVDRFTAHFKSLRSDNYYETSLRALYMLTLTGNAWKPGSVAVGGRVGRGDAGALGSSREGGQTGAAGALGPNAGRGSAGGAGAREKPIARNCGCGNGGSASLGALLSIAVFVARRRRPVLPQDRLHLYDDSLPFPPESR